MRRLRLNRIRNMPAAEIRSRARQEFLKLGGRFSLASGREMSDSEFLRHFPRTAALPSAKAAAALILDRIYRETHSPEERSALISKADSACCGRFDLMGFSALSFGEPIDWRLEPLSGRRTGLVHWSRIDYLDPQVAGDKKITWELNRHQHFVTLGQAYWMTGDEGYAVAFADQITSWMDANPPGIGINWASSLELAFRLVSWIWALYLFSDARAVTQELVARLLKFMLLHARHIDAFTSQYFSPNTHLTGEALGLVYLGVALPELESAPYWRERGLKILVEQLPIQV